MCRVEKFAAGSSARRRQAGVVRMTRRKRRSGISLRSVLATVAALPFLRVLRARLFGPHGRRSAAVVGRGEAKQAVIACKLPPARPRRRLACRSRVWSTSLPGCRRGTLSTPWTARRTRAANEAYFGSATIRHSLQSWPSKLSRQHHCWPPARPIEKLPLSGRSECVVRPSLREVVDEHHALRWLRRADALQDLHVVGELVAVEARIA